MNSSDQDGNGLLVIRNEATTLYEFRLALMLIGGSAYSNQGISENN